MILCRANSCEIACTVFIAQEMKAQPIGCLRIESHADLPIDAHVDLLVVFDALLLVRLPVLEVDLPLPLRNLLQHAVCQVLLLGFWYLVA